MNIAFFDFLCTTLIPIVQADILYTLGFPIFIRGVDYTILFMSELALFISGFISEFKTVFKVILMCAPLKIAKCII